MKAKLGKRFEKLFQAFDDNDHALEWCENRLLKKNLPVRPLSRAIKIQQYELCQNFTAEELKTFSSLLHRRIFTPGETLINIGDQAQEMFFWHAGASACLCARRRFAPPARHLFRRDDLWRNGLD